MYLLEFITKVNGHKSVCGQKTAVVFGTDTVYLPPVEHLVIFLHYPGKTEICLKENPPVFHAFTGS